MAPVTTTSLTYKQLHAEKMQQYRTDVPAMALFYTNGPYWKGLRIECPAIRKEFIDNVRCGRDPDGTLFFDSINDFPDSVSSSYYNVFYSTATQTEDKAAVVQFFTPGNQDIPYAEFVGRDPAGAVTYVMDGTVAKQPGTWKDLSIASVTADVRKSTKSHEFVLTINAISKKVKWNLPTSGSFANVNVTAYGSISFKGLKEITNGTTTYIDYNNDRIVFYKGADFLHGTDIVAYFIPEENSVADATALGNYQFISPTTGDVATWTDI